METVDADADKPDVGNDGGFLRVQSFKASEDEDVPTEIVSPMRRHLCRYDNFIIILDLCGSGLKASTDFRQACCSTLYVETRESP